VNKPTMICPHVKDYNCDHKDCKHFGEHEVMLGVCERDCMTKGITGGCHVVEFTGDEEDIE